MTICQNDVKVVDRASDIVQHNLLWLPLQYLIKTCGPAYKVEQEQYLRKAACCKYSCFCFSPPQGSMLSREHYKDAPLSSARDSLGDEEDWERVEGEEGDESSRGGGQRARWWR